MFTLKDNFYPRAEIKTRWLRYVEAPSNEFMLPDTVVLMAGLSAAFALVLEIF